MPRPFNPKTYQGWRKLVLKRDNETCVLCGAKPARECDHILSYSKHPELRFDTSNGRVLCKPCHIKTPTYGNQKRS